MIRRFVERKQNHQFLHSKFEITLEPEAKVHHGLTLIIINILLLLLSFGHRPTIAVPWTPPRPIQEHVLGGLRTTSSFSSHGFVYMWKIQLRVLLIVLPLLKFINMQNLDHVSFCLFMKCSCGFLINAPITEPNQSQQ